VFGELEINGNNFLAWRQDMRKLFKARGLQQTLPTAFRKDDRSPAIELFEEDKETGDPPTLEPKAPIPSPAAATSAPTDPRKKASPSVWEIKRKMGRWESRRARGERRWTRARKIRLEDMDDRCRERRAS
jgi:hypothetical protein